MKTLTTPNLHGSLSDEEAAKVLRKIAVALMDHGSVRLESGTMESAAIVRLMAKD